MRLVAIPRFVPEAAPLQTDRRAARHSLRGETMGTTWNVEFFARQEAQAGEVARIVQKELQRIVAQMSHFQIDSDLSRFNLARGGRWVELPGEFMHVLGAALSVARESGGAFDPTLGRLVNVWGFGPDGPRTEPPPQKDIDDGLARRGWDRILMDRAGRRAWQPGGVMLDFSSIAKGFAVDRVAQELDAAGILSYLVEIGGELRSKGVKPGGKPWWVALEPPPGAEKLAGTVIALCGQSVATSGAHRRCFDHGGVRYAHTIDPRTGAPLRNAVESATVVHDECMLADAYSTAILTLGEQDGLAFAKDHGLAALLVAATRDGPVIRWSTAFQAMLE